MNEVVYVWPDGTWCYYEHLEEYLMFMSDDFEKMFEEDFFK